VEVRVAALNAHDLWSLRGVGMSQHDLPRVLGSDAAWIGAGTGREVVVYPVIAAAPPETTEALDPMIAPAAVRRSAGRGRRARLLPHPQARSPVLRAGRSTAHGGVDRLPDAIRRRCRAPCDTVPVQGASGGVSTALTMMGSRAGLRVWVTGRTEQARDWAVEHGAAAVFASGERVGRGGHPSALAAMRAPGWPHRRAQRRVHTPMRTCSASSSSSARSSASAWAPSRRCAHCSHWWSANASCLRSTR